MEACVLVLLPRASACLQADQSNGVSAPQRSLREKASACFAWSAFSRRRTLIVQFRPGSLEGSRPSEAPPQTIERVRRGLRLARHSVDLPRLRRGGTPLRAFGKL